MKKEFSFAMVLLLVFNLFMPTGLLSTVSAVEEDEDIPVILMHRIVEAPSNEWTDTSTEVFKQFLKYLDDNKYTTLTADQYVDIKEGTEAAPENPILLTFDDGTVDFVNNALPVLEQYDMNAVLFIVSDWIDNAGNLSEIQLKELAANPNVSLENHTKDHSPDIWGTDGSQRSDITSGQAEDQISTASTYLSGITGKDPVLMAYPYGRYNDNAIAANEKYNIKYAFKAGSGDEDSYRMGRYYVTDHSLAQIADMIGGPVPDVEAEPRQDTVTETRTVYHETFVNGQGVATQSGGASLEVIDKDFAGNDDGKALYVSNRANDYDAADFNFSDIGLENGKTYTVSVIGYVDSDAAIPGGAKAVLSTVESYTWLSNVNYIAGEAFTLTNEFTVDTSKDLKLRIQSDETGANVPFYVGDILITERVTTDGEGIPEGEEVAAFTDFEDGTEQCWVARSGNEDLNATNETAKNGEYSLFVDNRQASTDAALIEFLDDMYPGYEYEFSLWVKLGPGEEDTPLQLSAAQTVSGETSYYPPVIEPKMVTSDDWVLLEGTYSVPNNIEALSFYVEETYDAEQAAGVSYYIDNFKAEVFVPAYEIEDITPLKDIYQDYFLIGNAVGSNHFAGRDLDLLTKHHNVVTAENVMKPESYYTDGAFTHSSQDQFLNLAIENGLKIHGHVLLWHSQSEDSLYQNADGTYKSREEALANMGTHIEKVMTSANDVAGDSLISWDVVNEALDGSFTNPEDWKANLRTSSGWLQSIGDDYLYEAYLKARQVADDLGQQDMILYYNDYNDQIQSKATTMYYMVKDINERYALEYPEDDRKLISGVGMQAHYTTSVKVENVRTSLERFIELGVEVSITELDIGASETTTLTEEEELEQAYFYAQLFDLYKEHAAHISRVTLWGLSDGYSWRSEDNPLLFDSNLQAKLAYDAIADTETFLAENEPVEVVARAGSAAYGTPTIDGIIEDLWNGAPVLPIDRFQSAHNGATGDARVLWDDENVYVLVEVNDSVLDKTSSATHEQDSVEVFIDEQNSKAASFSEGHGQYRVNFDNEQSFNPGDISEGFESRTIVNGTNYLVEMKIPFKTTEVEDGHTIGFDVQINDAADGTRNSAAIWNDYTGMGWSDPSVFGNLTLTGGTDTIPKDND